MFTNMITIKYQANKAQILVRASTTPRLYTFADDQLHLLLN